MLGILPQLGGGLSLLLGLGTRFGAIVILGLTAITHIYYTALDLNLFWIALMVGYVLRGAGACSFDRLLAQGLALCGVRDRFFQRNQTGSNRLYLLALRLWLMLTLMLTSVHVPYVMSEKAMRFLSWLPLHSATLLFGSVGSVALPNRARNKSPGTSGSRRCDGFTPRLQGRCPEGSARSC